MTSLVMKATKPTEEELVRLMRGGSREAFAELYQRCQSSVYRFVLQMTGSPEIAEDVTQETFIVLIRGVPPYDDTRGTVRAFLIGIARNQVLRRRKKDGPFANSDENTDGLENEASQSIDFARNEAVAELRKAILSLPRHYREVIVLCELQEMSYAEAAQALDCAIGTVRSRLNRARAILTQKLIAEQGQGREPQSKSERCFA